MPLSINLMFTYQAQCFRYLYLTFQKEVYTFHCSVYSVHTNATYGFFQQPLCTVGDYSVISKSGLVTMNYCLHYPLLCIVIFSFETQGMTWESSVSNFIFLVFIQHSSLLRQPESQSCHQLLYCLFFPSFESSQT